MKNLKRLKSKKKQKEKNKKTRQGNTKDHVFLTLPKSSSEVATQQKFNVNHCDFVSGYT